MTLYTHTSRSGLTLKNAVRYAPYVICKSGEKAMNEPRTEPAQNNPNWTAAARIFLKRTGASYKERREFEPLLEARDITGFQRLVLEKASIK